MLPHANLKLESASEITIRIVSEITIRIVKDRILERPEGCAIPGITYYLCKKFPMQTALWKKVLAHDFDQPLTSFGFSTRVARENFWTRNFTSKAIIEYKKFMFLAATSDMMVSPSPI